MTSVFIETASVNEARSHCGDCYKVLDSIYDGATYDEERAIDLMLSACERHIHLHPNHTPNVFVKRVQLPIEKDMQALKESL